MEKGLLYSEQAADSSSSVGRPTQRECQKSGLGAAEGLLGEGQEKDCYRVEEVVFVAEEKKADSTP